MTNRGDEHRCSAEIELRKLRWMVAAIMLGVLSVAALSRENPDASIVEAREFRLAAVDGRVRARLYLEGNEPALTLYDAQGRAKVAVEITGHGAGLIVSDPANPENVSGLLLMPSGPVLTLSDRASGATLLAHVSGNNASLTFQDAGKTRLQMGRVLNGFGLRMFDSDERPIGALVEGTRGAIFSMSRSGQEQIGLATSAEGPLLRECYLRTKLRVDPRYLPAALIEMRVKPLTYLSPKPNRIDGYERLKIFSQFGLLRDRLETLGILDDPHYHAARVRAATARKPGTSGCSAKVTHP